MSQTCFFMMLLQFHCTIFRPISKRERENKQKGIRLKIKTQHRKDPGNLLLMATKSKRIKTI